MHTNVHNNRMGVHPVMCIIVSPQGSYVCVYVCVHTRTRAHTPPHSFKDLKMKSLYVDPTSDGCPPKENKSEMWTHSM